MGASLLIAGAASQAADKYYAPLGTGYDPGAPNSYTNPFPFTAEDANDFISSNPEANLYLESGAGDYLLDTWRLPSCQTVRILGINAPGADPAARPVLRYAVPTAPDPNQPPDPAHLFNGPGWGTWLIYALAVSTRFEARDLILDGNWPAWAAAKTGASPAYVSGFALGALYAKAPQGWIENVHVRNCGANGITPGPYWSASGRECFPLFLHATQFGSDLWTVEDCEVSDFRALHGGYCTAIMVQQEELDLAEENPQVRVAAVRRCQVRGSRHVFAFGSAKSAGVIYSDNVVLNASRGFNHDSGEMRNFNFDNNILLDVGMLGNIGGAHWGPSGFVNYTINDNAIRLRGVPLNQDYRSYEWISNTVGSLTAAMPVSDPGLSIGRLETGYSVGLRLAGTDGIVFSNNRFTTRPMAEFYEPLPGGGNAVNARWTGVYRPHYDTSTLRLCNQTEAVTDNGGLNLLSAVAMDFTSLTAFVPFPPESIFNGDTVYTNTFEELIAIEGLPAGLPPDFIPAGGTGRAGPCYDTGDQLYYVNEIQVGQPVVLGELVQVRARYLMHLMGRETTGETVLLPNTPWLRLRVTGPDGTTRECTGTGTSYGWLFEYDPDTSPGRDYLVVYDDRNGPYDPDASVWSWAEYVHGTTVRFERTPDVADDRRFTPGTLRISRSGPTTGDLDVTFEPVTTGTVRPAQPDVDFRLYLAGTTTIVPFLSGGYSVEIPTGASEVLLDVKPLGGNGKPDEAEYEVAYFRLLSGSGYAVAPPGPDATGIPGADTMAVTLWDGPKYRLSALDHFAGGGGSSALSAVGSGLAAEEGDSSEEVLQLDPLLADGSKAPAAAALPGWPGPEDEALAEQLLAEGADPGPILDWWHPDVRVMMAMPAIPGMEPEAGADLLTATLENSAMASVPSFIYTWAYGINNLGSGGYSLPQISGGAFTTGPTYAAGWWQAPDYDGLNSVTSASSCYFFEVDEGGNLVGSIGAYAYYYNVSSNGFWTLQPLVPNGAGRANAISPNGAYAAGYTRGQVNGAYYWRPVRWWWDTTYQDWVVTDLGSPDGNLACTALAEDVRDDGMAVGRTYYAPEAAWRAFRTPVYPGTITGINDLLKTVKADPDAPLSLKLKANAAYGINAGGEVVGSSDTHYNRGGTWKAETRAALWKSTGGDGVSLGVLAPNLGGSSSLNPSRSEAFAINQRAGGATVVGTGYATATGEPRAFVCDVGFQTSGGTPSPGKMLNLNDPHLTFIEESGWVLRAAENINDEGWIVGNGFLNDLPRGFLLVPHAISSQ